jgi:glycosyltransferase involved in cell wall biosynthesis
VTIAGRSETKLPGIGVLFLHPSGAFSGAARSLLELLHGFPPDAVAPRLIMPRGQAAALFERAGYPVATIAGMTQFDCTRFGHYRGLRWLIILREFFYLPFTALALWRMRRASHCVDLIHANEVTAIVAALLAKFLIGKPLVVHVRSVQQQTGVTLRRRLLARLLKRHADAVIAIDATVLESLPPEIGASIVHNGFAPERAEPPPAAVAALRRRFHDGSLRVGMVGSLLPLKGVYEFLEAARISVRNGVNADFVIVGSNVRPLSGAQRALLEFLGFARDVERDLHRFIARNGLQDRVHLLGFQSEISAVYRSLDLLCFPSHLAAIGRPVLEAAWFSVPSLAAVERPLQDTFVDGETGLCIPARDPQAIADAVAHLCGNRDRLKRMGEAARRLAEQNFNSAKNARCVLEIYRRLCEGPGATGT